MKQKVALVLSMGGARGMAHIGVIEELLKHDFEITSIAGSSMGAMIGAMYAAGKLNECKEWMLTWDKRKLLQFTDIRISREGLVKGNKLMEEMRSILPPIKIEELPIPYVALATDIAHECEVRMDSGSLYEAIRASISLPMIFHPVKDGNRILIDGGILNPLPIRHVARIEGDMLVAVDVNAPSTQTDEKKLSPYQLLTTSSRLMMQELARNEIRQHRPDILIELPATRFDMMEFHHAATIIEYGASEARKALSSYQ